MKLTKKTMTDLLVLLVGDDFSALVDLLYGKEKVSEFDIAEQLQVDIKVIRKQLYLLYNHSFVIYDRKKDKIKGWYIYYWTLAPDQIKYVYYKNKKEQLRRLEERLDLEGRELFFSCPQGCVRLDFDQGLHYEFHCPECGHLLDQENNEKQKETLLKRVMTLREEITHLESEQVQKREDLPVVEEKPVKKKVAPSKPAVKLVTVKKVVEKQTVLVIKKKVTKPKVAVKTTATKKKVVVKKKVVPSKPAVKRVATKKKTVAKKKVVKKVKKK